MIDSDNENYYLKRIGKLGAEELARPEESPYEGVNRFTSPGANLVSILCQKTSLRRQPRIVILKTGQEKRPQAIRYLKAAKTPLGLMKLLSV